MTSAPVRTPAPSPPAFGLRLGTGLLGVLLAAVVAGLSNRVPGLALADVQGAVGLARDDASWLTTAYAAGELAAMPFATWFAITFSMRRFHLALLAVALVLAAAMPFVRDLHLLLALRALQGMAAGALIPVLMMAALLFLPPPIRLHGLALYALTATFSPNVAPWLAALCVDGLDDWRWVYWHLIPPGLLAMALVAWGIPATAAAPGRLRTADWPGLALGVPGLALLVVALDQGVRLNWLHAPIVSAALLVGGVFTVLFLACEWRHPAPFIRLQMLRRRNLGLGFSVFLALLVISATAVALPINVLSQLQGFRMAQSADLGLLVALPQLLLGSGVAVLLSRRGIDARHVFAAGLACIAVACWLGSQLGSAWMVAQFVPAQLFYALGLPLAIVPLLFLATSVVQPAEGPSVAGIVNTFRAFGAVLGGAIVGQLGWVRGRFHEEALLGHAGLQLSRLPQSTPGLDALAQVVAQQAGVLAAADVYLALGVMALLLVPLVLRLQHVPAQQTASAA
ncbi:MFS transporter [uncultured Hydrogenophaga sp.]|uniref:MFS transporter n=1 Tax=uncultured Hydrogenophaga sp. TaxID=199683 RepID=UPI00258EC18F|nr:MFS transporter [uncultured Hydrogenophaga sp.]